MGFVAGKQKKIPLIINHSTENTLTAYPTTGPRLNDRRGRRFLPQVASIPWGTVYVIFTMRMAVLTIELNASVEAT